MDISVLEKCPLFKGIPSYSITPMMGCLRAHEKYYGKNEFIYRSGDKISEISIVLSGNVQVIKEDMWGNTTILANLKEGMLFGEAFVLGGVDKIPLSVLSSEKSRVLFLDKKRTVTPCASSCQFHHDVSDNMLKILADKNIFLTERMEHLSRRTLKEKVLSFLSSEAQRTGSRTFEIGLNRQEMADYLAADRSALSAILSKLKDEGFIDYSKNRFTLK